MAWDSFVAGDKVYLAAANQGSVGRYETHSRIYIMDQTGKMTVIQNISTQGASDVKFFQPPGQSDVYLIVANQRNNAGQTRIPSQVIFCCRWFSRVRFCKLSQIRGRVLLRIRGEGQNPLPHRVFSFLLFFVEIIVYWSLWYLNWQWMRAQGLSSAYIGIMRMLSHYVYVT